MISAQRGMTCGRLLWSLPDRLKRWISIKENTHGPELVDRLRRPHRRSRVLHLRRSKEMRAHIRGSPPIMAQSGYVAPSRYFLDESGTSGDLSKARPGLDFKQQPIFVLAAVEAPWFRRAKAGRLSGPPRGFGSASPTSTPA